MENTLICGVYVAKPDNNCRWIIYRYGVEVGSMYFGGGYPNKYRCSMTKLVWNGDLPTGHCDPKSEHYGIHFDTSVHDTAKDALKDFTKRADRLIMWRAKNARS